MQETENKPHARDDHEKMITIIKIRVFIDGTQNVGSEKSERERAREKDFIYFRTLLSRLQKYAPNKRAFDIIFRPEPELQYYMVTLLLPA